MQCFKDEEIKSIINKQSEVGKCDFCGAQSINVYDIESNSTLTELFDGLLEVYTPASNLPKDFPKENLDSLKNIMHSTWSIFNLGTTGVYNLLKNICHEKYRERPELFDGTVGILEIAQVDYLEKNSILRTFKWDDFVEDIKKKSRFHTNHFNTKMLEPFLFLAARTYKKGAVFYRARICDNPNGYDKSQMGAPEKAPGGRANPEGIRCLYLADSEETTLHEIRAGELDYVTIGEFVAQKDLVVANLDKIDKISPFLSYSSTSIDYTQHAINIEHLKRIGLEIAKPLRRYDSPLDYLPTQFICDYIKSCGFDGIEYLSTMHRGGFNLAVFYEGHFQCSDTTVYDIKSLTYTYDKLKKSCYYED